MNRLRIALMLSVCAAVLGAAESARAQNGATSANDNSADEINLYDEAVPFTQDYGGAFYDPRLEAFFRVGFHLENYGDRGGQTHVGITRHFAQPDGTLFVDAQYNLDYQLDQGVSLGLVRRWLHPGFILGLGFWYDGDETQFDNFFHQLGASVELLTRDWDARFNLYAPIGERTQVSEQFAVTGTNAYKGNIVGQNALFNTDVSLFSIDGEIAHRLFGRNLWAYAGGYALEGGGVDVGGVKAGVRGWALEDVMLNCMVTHDDYFKTNVVFGVQWFIGHHEYIAMAPADLYDRLYIPVVRDDYVHKFETTTSDVVAFTDTSGNLITLVHVDSTAAAGGDGTFENPLNSISDIAANSSAGDIVLMHAGSSFPGQAVTLKDNQRLLGEGVTGGHNISTSKGTISLPETAAGALAGPVPVVNNAPGNAAVLLADGNEVSGFTIDGGNRGIAALSGATGTDINRMTIQNTASNGIEITPSTNTDIDDITFNNIGGNDIVLNAHNSTITDVTSNNGKGIGILIQNATGTTTISNYTHNGGTTSTGGISLTSPGGTVAISGVNVTDGTGIGLSISGNAATTTINNYNYDGNTTGGGGLRLASASSDVAVSNTTIREGTGTGISITNGSASLTFTGMNVVNTGDAAFHLSGGSTTVTFDGDISQGANAELTDIRGGHSGSVTFQNGTLSATDGTGFQFSNADGTYNFDGTNTLAGGDAGIDILNGSSGTFSFATTSSITNPTGTAFNVNGSDATVTYNGTIDNDAGRSVAIESNTGGTVDITGQVTDSGTGVLINNNSGGTFNLSGGLDLDTTTNTAVTLTNNTGATTQLADVDIDTTSGSGVAASGGGTLQITGTSTVDTTTGTGVDLDGMTLNASGISFESISVNGATNGIVLNDLAGGAFSAGSGGTSVGDGGLIQNTTGDAVSVNDVENASFNFLDVRTAGGDGFAVDHTSTNSSNVTINQSNVNGAGSDGIVTTSTGTGTFTVSYTNNGITNVTNEGMSFEFNNLTSTANATLTDNNVVANGGNALRIVGQGSGTKTINFLADDNSFVNNHTGATADIDVSGSTTLNATVTDNIFTNQGTGDDFAADTNAAASRIRLNLNGNTADSGAGVFELTNTAGTYSVEDSANVNANNTGTVNLNGAIVDDPGSIPTP